MISLIDGDLELRYRIPLPQRRKAVEHVLLYLHQQDVLTLNYGMTVMRRAMTINVNPEKRGSYLKEDYQRLDEHYREKCVQVHVMREYAQIALREMAEALTLVLHYFSDSSRDFTRRYFSGRGEVLKLAISEDSWQSIIGSLNETQKEIVANDEDGNRLVLAGPGSGKTRVIVHRIAYILCVRRVPANSIIALTFNRHAANEIRQRLYALVGTEPYGVNVFTYHSMAMRLTGTRFERKDSASETALKRVLQHAVELLEGKHLVEGEDDVREQLLRGYRYIHVDEYQDIDDWQYRLVRALAGLHLGGDGNLCILAVGDDDQNIYAWRDTSNRHIERFCEDYGANIHYLVESYRSTQYIIDAANQVIEHNPARLKTDTPIRIDSAREQQLSGSAWRALDKQRQGRVLRLRIFDYDRSAGNLQAQAAVGELERLLILEAGDWDGCAILARSHRYIWPIQAWCEQSGLTHYMAAEKESSLSLTRQRTFVKTVELLRGIKTPITPVMALEYVFRQQLDADWHSFFETAFMQFKCELGDCHLLSQAIIAWLYDYVQEIRQEPKKGLYLGTVHSAKGLEFRHVILLDGGWTDKLDQINDERRLYYVGMTRAAQTLTLCEFASGNPFSCQLSVPAELEDFNGIHDPELERRYQKLSLKHIYLDYAGLQDDAAPIHAAIRNLNPNDRLKIMQDGERYSLLDESGQVVGCTSQLFEPAFEVDRCDVAAIIIRYAEDSDEPYRKRLKCSRWEVVIPRICGRMRG